MLEGRSIFRVDVDADRDVFVAYAAPKAMSATCDWDTGMLDEVDSDTNFNKLFDRCKDRGLTFDGLLFDSSCLTDNPTLWLGYFGQDTLETPD